MVLGDNANATGITITADQIPDSMKVKPMRLKGGPYNGFALSDIPAGQIVYVTQVNDDTIVVDEGKTEEVLQEEFDSADVDVGEYPEFDGIKYFKPYEFKCKCSDPDCIGKKMHMNHTLLVVADRVRERFGKPMTIISALRCPKHNAAVGGVAQSRHMAGKACDFSVSGESAQSTYLFAKQQSEIRYTYAITSTSTHMDVL